MYYFGNHIFRLLLTALTAASITSFSYAQEYIDIFKSSYSFSPNNSFDGSDSEASIKETKADLTLPLKVNNRLAILTGISYDRITTSYNPNSRNSSVTGVALKFGANVKFTSKWSGTYLILPKVASDLNEISHNDLQLGGAVLMKYAKSEHFNYKFGVYSNREHFGTIIAPIFGFYYLDPTDRFEANVLLPSLIDINYAVTKNFKTGINFNGQVKTYNLNDVSGDHDRYLSRSSNELTAYVEHKMDNGIHFQVAMGHSFARSYRIYDEGVSLAVPLVYFGDDRQQLNTDFSDGLIFKASVFYRFDFNKKG